MKVVANLVVDFGGGEGDVVLELDDILNVPLFSEADQLLYAAHGFLPDNPDEETLSNFSPGSSIYFRMQYDESKLELVRLAVTHGQIEDIRVDRRDASKIMLWILEDDTHELDYFVNRVVEERSYVSGNAVGVRLLGRKTVGLINNKSILPANTYIQYDTYFNIYKLISPKVELEEGETYPITVVAYMRPVQGKGGVK